jgi:hypothetical protein
MRFQGGAILFGQAPDDLRDAAALARSRKSESTFD